MTVNARHSTKWELARTVARETQKIEKAQRRPLVGDIKEKRRTIIVLVIGVLGLVGGPLARYTVWRRDYEPTLSARLGLAEHISLPAGMHLVSTN